MEGGHAVDLGDGCVDLLVKQSGDASPVGFFGGVGKRRIAGPGGVRRVAKGEGESQGGQARYCCAV
jgi:hypothetical protein